MVERNHKGKVSALRQAARELGDVYLALHEREGLPLDTWALPQVQKTMPFFLALGDVYGSDFERSISMRKKGYLGRKELYRSAYNTVMPKVKTAAQAWAKDTLEVQEGMLWRLGGRLQGIPNPADPADPAYLHEAALRVARRAGGLDANRQDLEGATARYGMFDASWAAGRQYEFKVEVERQIRQRVAAAVKAEQFEETVRRDQYELLATLFAHPKGLAILAAYHHSIGRGTDFTLPLVREAALATREFREELGANPDHIWRYQVFVVGGVSRLGLHDVDGFPEYAVAIGQILGQSVAESVVNQLGLVLLCVGLALGPAGVAVVGILDLALSVTSGVLAYLREREQELGAQASTFRGKEEPLAVSSGYEDTALAGAAAFLSAIGLFGDAKKLLRVKPRPPEVLRPTVPKKKNANVLEIDKLDHSAGFKGDQALERDLVNDRRLNRYGARPKKSKPTAHLEHNQYTHQKLSANRRKLAKQTPDDATPILGPGAPREFTPEPEAPAIVRGTDDRLASQSRATTDPMEYIQESHEYWPNMSLLEEDDFIVAHKAADDAPDLQVSNEPWANMRFFEEEDIVMAHKAAVNPLDLERLSRATSGSGPVLTRELQMYDASFERWANEVELTNWARKRLPDGSSDPIIPTIKVDKHNPTELDHIVAVELIKQFPGFGQLSRENQHRLLTLRENLMPVSRRVNRARQSKPYSLWEGLPDHPIPPHIKEQMVERERALAGLIQERIYRLLEEQNRVRGLNKLQ